MSTYLAGHGALAGYEAARWRVDSTVSIYLVPCPGCAFEPFSIGNLCAKRFLQVLHVLQSTLYPHRLQQPLFKYLHSEFFRNPKTTQYPGVILGPNPPPLLPSLHPHHASILLDRSFPPPLKIHPPTTPLSPSSYPPQPTRLKIGTHLPPLTRFVQPTSQPPKDQARTGLGSAFRPLVARVSPCFQERVCLGAVRNQWVGWEGGGMSVWVGILVSPAKIVHGWEGISCGRRSRGWAVRRTYTPQSVVRLGCVRRMAIITWKLGVASAASVVGVVGQSCGLSVMRCMCAID